MIHRNFSPDTYEGDEKDILGDIIIRLDEKRDAVVLKWAEHKTIKGVTESGWKEYKDWILKNIFNNTCAYCEGLFTWRTQVHGEHYRPKGGVTFRSIEDSVLLDNNLEDGCKTYKKGDLVRVYGNVGYFWLAFDWRNILPACHHCNIGESASGKMNQFPVKNQHHCCPDTRKLSEQLDVLEEPYLLHPFFGEKPEDHLIIDREGVAKPIQSSLHGWHTMCVLNLNKIELVCERNEYMDKVVLDMVKYFHKLSNVKPSLREDDTTFKECLDMECDSFKHPEQFFLSYFNNYETLVEESELIFIRESSKISEPLLDSIITHYIFGDD